MKKILKKTLTLGAVATAAISLASCGIDYGEHENENFFKGEFEVAKDQYIVVEENGVNTLHKGSLYSPYHDVKGGVYTGYGHSFTPILKFNCGETLQTYEFVLYFDKCPKEEKYDKICDCAYTLTKEETEHKHTDYIYYNDLKEKEFCR